jgi:nucleoside-diphosphate-sugar epimerase
MVSGNVVAVANLVAALASAPVRLIHLGSAAEYGHVPAGNPVTESTDPRPVGPYGITKLAGTEIVRAARSDAVVLRVFNPIGPGMPASTLAGRVAAGLRGGDGDDGEVRVGSLAAHRDFVDVRDVADAILAAAGSPGPLPPVLNVGSGRATPLREVVTCLTEIAGPGRRIVEEATGGSARSAEVSWQQADIGAIGRALGWAPATDLTTSLRDLWEDTACLT